MFDSVYYRYVIRFETGNLKTSTKKEKLTSQIEEKKENPFINGTKITKKKFRNKWSEENRISNPSNKLLTEEK